MNVTIDLKKGNCVVCGSHDYIAQNNKCLSCIAKSIKEDNNKINGVKQ